MSGTPNILVIGSSNTDMVVRTTSIPKPGQTLMGSNFLMAQGGKGANQAVAAARLGGNVTFIACLGADVFGEDAFRSFVDESINTDWIVRTNEAASGIALICVDEKGENSIVVAPGANGLLQPEHINSARTAFERADIVLTQLEVPVQTVNAVIALAYSLDKRVILNPAPATSLPKGLLSKCYAITPNESEAEMLSEELESLSSTHKIVTAGAKGVMADGERIPSPAVTPIDTTAAGDAFNGALAVALGNGSNLNDACRFAVLTASLSVTRFGAQISLPTRHEVESFMMDQRMES